jgi:hypothetical protein
MRVLSWWWVIPAVLAVSGVPATAWSQALTAELRPRAAAEIQDQIFEIQAVATAAAISASVGQPLIGITQDPGVGILSAGIWHLLPASVVVSAPQPTVNPGFALGQNVPNPFGRSTQIGFAVSQRDLVTLRVYDVRGRVVSTLVDQSLEAGEYEVVVTAHTLSPGIYLYRLQSSQDSITRKLLLLDDGGAK